jgi:fructose-bisphosphate aldolase, class I
MNRQELADTASAMVAPGKGLLAMDESKRTCNKRFEDVGIAPTEENRRAYRELILTTPGLETAISGAILYDETIRQAKKDGTSFIKNLLVDLARSLLLVAGLRPVRPARRTSTKFTQRVLRMNRT